MALKSPFALSADVAYGANIPAPALAVMTIAFAGKHGKRRKRDLVQCDSEHPLLAVDIWTVGMFWATPIFFKYLPDTVASRRAYHHVHLKNVIKYCTTAYMVWSTYSKQGKRLHQRIPNHAVHSNNNQ